MAGFYVAQDPDQLTMVSGRTYTSYVDNWWLVDDRGWPVFHYRWKGAPPSAQCNPSELVVTRLAKLTPQYYVKQIPLVIIPHHCNSDLGY